MIIIAFFVLHWYSSLFCQSMFHHRYAAHQMFTMSKRWEKFFFVLSYLTMGSSYLSAYVYGILHRLHHAYADTELDPHSPSFDKNPFAMMWRTAKIYTAILEGKMKVEEKFKKDLPSWPVVDRLMGTWVSRLIWVGLYFSFYFFFATHWLLWILFPLQIIMGPLHGVIINWFAHKYGDRPFKDIKNTSGNLNLFWSGILMWGEGYHHNHHKYSTRPKFSLKWYELDPMWPVLKFLNRLLIIRRLNLGIEN